MKHDDATHEALEEYVSGRAYHPKMTPVTKRMLEVFLFFNEHREELDALTKAKEGNATELAELIETKGELQTADARAYVAARVRGDPKRRLKCEANTFRRARLWLRVTEIVEEEGMTQAAALKLFMEENPIIGFDTIRSDFKRGGEELRKALEALGFKTGPAFQKKKKTGRRK